MTHYGWEDLERSRPYPSMIQHRVHVAHLRPWAALEICFPYGIKAEVDRGRGRMLALQITRREA